MIEQVGQLLRNAAEQAVLPLFGRLAAGDIMEKAPGEVVTVADREAELLITAGLRALLPGSAVLGEEAAAADPGLLRVLSGAGPVWLVDPVDGTANFAAGREPFAMMVALRRGGLTEASWILEPRADRLAYAVRGAGAYVDGAPVTVPAGTVPFEALRGVVLTRFLPRRLRGGVAARAAGLGAVLPGLRCAGREYPDIATGVQHFAVFWRTLPWDHAAGALFVEEAGGVVRRLDGSPYDPADNRAGLLAAASEAIWYSVRDVLFPTFAEPAAGTGPPAATAGGRG